MFFGSSSRISFYDFKNKTEIIESIKDLQLSRMKVTRTRRIEKLSADVTDQLQDDINKCVAFSLQFDESTDVIDTAQLMVCGWYSKTAQLNKNFLK